MSDARVKLPSRGRWIAARATYYRAQGVAVLKAITEAATDWDEGRPCGDWDYAKHAGRPA